LLEIFLRFDGFLLVHVSHAQGIQAQRLGGNALAPSNTSLRTRGRLRRLEPQHCQGANRKQREQRTQDDKTMP